MLHTPTEPNPTASWNHKQEGQTIEALIRAAHAKLDAEGHHMSPSRVSRLIRRMHRAERNPEAVLDALSYYALSYRDITGEQAVWNVATEARHRARDESLQAEIARGLE